MTSTQYGGNIIIVAVDGFRPMTNSHVVLTKQEEKWHEHHAELPKGYVSLPKCHYFLD